jgi:hypothetical protein
MVKSYALPVKCLATLREDCMRQRRPGPSSERRTFNLSRDPLGVKTDMLRFGITIPMVAARAEVSHITAFKVLGGYKTSVYVERAARGLIAEARERVTPKPA